MNSLHTPKLEALIFNVSAAGQKSLGGGQKLLSATYETPSCHAAKGVQFGRCYQKWVVGNRKNT